MSLADVIKNSEEGLTNAHESGTRTPEDIHKDTGEILGMAENLIQAYKQYSSPYDKYDSDSESGIMFEEYLLRCEEGIVKYKGKKKEKFFQLAKRLGLQENHRWED